MSGTSVDGIDAALVEIANGELRFISGVTHHYPADLRNQLLQLNHEPTIALGDFIQLDRRIGLAFAESVQQLLTGSARASDDIVCIGSHGQTLFHLPHADPPGTLQVGDPNTIAALTGIDTIGDFRRADICAGGQGAPLAPAFHASTLASTEPRVILNLGGIANITGLEAIATTGATGVIRCGFDTGPANTLLDSWAEQHIGTPYDDEGRWARTGTAHNPLLEQLLSDSYFSLPAPKSTGRDYFNLRWLGNYLQNHAPLAPKDVQATLIELTAVSVADAIRGFFDTEIKRNEFKLLVCGGGAKNNYLLERLSYWLDTSVTNTGTHGIDADYCEAMVFAWLAYLHKHGKRCDLTKVTGASAPVVLGGMYPAGSRP